MEVRDKPYKFDLICRICLNENENMQSLLQESDFNIKTKFEICTRIPILDDGLPESICEPCFKDLQLSYEFYERSQQSDKYLRATIINEQNKANKLDIKEEFDNKNKCIDDESDEEHYDEMLDKQSDGDDSVYLDECLKGESSKVCKKKVDKKKSVIKKCKDDYKGPSQCTICGLKVKSHSALITHMRSHTGEKPFQCSECSREFTQKSSLRIHYERRHLNIRSKVKKVHTCEKCGKNYGNSNNLKNHLRIHTGEMPYECSFCSKRFAQMGSLTVHKRRHTGEKPHICNICGKAFVEYSHLRRHQSVHSEEKPFVCNICGKGVKSPYALKQHSKLHTNEKEHICDHCGMTFFFKGNLDSHIRVVHSERSGQCNICHKMFSNIADHMVKHTGEKPYHCEICDKSFSHNRGLIVHNRQHSEANKFRCNVDGCDQSFTAQWILECHLLKHSGQTPFVCKYCSKGFLRGCHLNKHMKANHPNEIKSDRPIVT